MTDENGKKVCLSGCEGAGIKKAVQTGFKGLPDMDPFKEIDPIQQPTFDLQARAESIMMIKESSKYIVEQESDSDGEWCEENDLNEDGNIFDTFDDELEE